MLLTGKQSVMSFQINLLDYNWCLCNVGYQFCITFICVYVIPRSASHIFFDTCSSTFHLLIRKTEYMEEYLKINSSIIFNQLANFILGVSVLCRTMDTTTGYVQCQKDLHSKTHSAFTVPLQQQMQPDCVFIGYATTSNSAQYY